MGIESQKYHHILGKYFHRQYNGVPSGSSGYVSSRIISELPWQFARAGEYNRLKAYFLNFTFLHLVLANNEVDAITCWKLLTAHFNMPAEFARALQDKPAKGMPAEVSENIYSVSSFLQVVGSHETAVLFLQFVLKFDEQQFGTDSYHVARDLSSLALEFNRMEQPAEAEGLLERAVNTLRSSSPVNANSLAVALSNLGLHYATRSLIPQAKRCWQEAHQILDTSTDAGIKALANILYNESLYNPPHEAVPKLRRALQIVENLYGHHHTRTAIYLDGLAGQLTGLRPVEAEKLARRALNIYQVKFGSNDARCIGPMLTIAIIYERALRTDDAKAILLEAMAIEQHSGNPRKQMIAFLSKRLEQVLRIK